MGLVLPPLDPGLTPRTHSSLVKERRNTAQAVSLTLRAIHG